MFSPKGDQLSYPMGNTVVVRSLVDPDAAPIRLNGPGEGLGGIGFSPDGRTLYSAVDNRLLVWDLVGDRRFVRSAPVQPQPDALDVADAKVSPDGRKVANLVMPGDGREAFGVQFLDVTSGQRSPPSAFRESNTYWADTAWSPDSKKMASAHEDQWVDLWDGATGRAVGRHRVPDRYGVADSVRFSGDSTRLVVGTMKGWVYAVDSSSLQIVSRAVQVKADVPTHGVAANSNGTRALVWIDHRLHLLALDSGRVIHSVDPRLDVNGWTWLPDGKAVVVVGTDPSQDGHAAVAFLDPEALSTRSEVSGPQVAGGGWIQFSSDGTRFTTSGGDRVGLWDVRVGGYLGSVPAERDSVAGFAQGGSGVVIASRDWKVSVWDPNPQSAIQAACRTAARDLTESEWRTYLPDRSRFRVC
jgi:WD40 repeat protein